MCRAEQRTEERLERSPGGDLRAMFLADLPVHILERLCTFLAADDVCRFKAFRVTLLLHEIFIKQ